MRVYSPMALPKPGGRAAPPDGGGGGGGGTTPPIEHVVVMTYPPTKVFVTLPGHGKSCVCAIANVGRSRSARTIRVFI